MSSSDKLVVEGPLTWAEMADPAYVRQLPPPPEPTKRQLRNRRRQQQLRERAKQERPTTARVQALFNRFIFSMIMGLGWRQLPGNGPSSLFPLRLVCRSWANMIVQLPSEIWEGWMIPFKYMLSVKRSIFLQQHPDGLLRMTDRDTIARERQARRQIAWRGHWPHDDHPIRPLPREFRPADGQRRNKVKVSLADQVRQLPLH